MVNSPFLTRFVSGLLSDAEKVVTRNRDYWRYPAPLNERLHHSLLDLVRGSARRLGWRRPDARLHESNFELAAILARQEGMTWLFENLADDESRELLLHLLNYRVLGPGHVELPLRKPGYWNLRSRQVSAATIQKGVGRSGPWVLHEFRSPGRNGDIRVVASSYGFATTFLVEHYALRRGPLTIAAQPGDVVIDGGGCWGDTALYFADAVGDTGKVYCFEFDEGNLEILEANLSRNPALQSRIEVVRHPMWKTSDREFRYESKGPGTSVGDEPGSAGKTTTTLSIDDLVSRNSLNRVDFIKMDIEGAEMDALQGAEQTIRRWKPRLAISVYHSLDDYFRLARFIHDLQIGYRLYLHHATAHNEETLVFAIADQKRP
jgi:FkbM family methyltransferase